MAELTSDPQLRLVDLLFVFVIVLLIDGTLMRIVTPVRRRQDRLGQGVAGPGACVGVGQDGHGRQSDTDLDEDEDDGVEDQRADGGHPVRPHGSGGGQAQQAHATGHEEGGQTGGAEGVAHPQGVEHRPTPPGGHHGAGRHHQGQPQAHPAHRRRRPHRAQPA